MALTDVINRLTEVNEDQLVETQHVRVEIESLSDRVTELLEFNKQDRLERLEQMREGARAFEAPSMTGGDAGVGAAGKKGGGFNLPGIGGLGRALAGFFGLTGFLATLSVFGGRLLTLFRVVGRFLGPLGIVITAIIGTFATVEGFIKGYEEGGILGGLEGAVKGFFGAIVAAPLDLVREAAAWIAMQLGFAKVSTFLKSFSFAEIYDEMITSIFDGLQNVVNLVTDIFYFPEDGEGIGLQNFGNLIDTVMLPLNAAINYVGGIFGWVDPEGEPFRFSVFVSNSIKNGMNHALSVFGFEPTDTEQTLMSFLMDTFDRVFASITQVVTDFGNRLLIEGEIVFRKILTFIQNIPDQLMKFISDNLSFTLPAIVVPNPIPRALRKGPVPKEDYITIFEGTGEIRIPGGANAAANIAERNAALEADIARLQAQITVAPNTSGIVLEGMNGAAGQTGGVQVIPVPVPQPQPTQGGGAAVAGDQNVSSSSAAEVPNHYMGMHPDLVYSGSMPTSR